MSKKSPKKKPKAYSRVVPAKPDDPIYQTGFLMLKPVRPRHRASEQDQEHGESVDGKRSETES